MKHFLFSMILVLCAAVAHGAPTMQGPNYVTNGTRTITWTFDTTTAATPLFGVVGTCAAKVDIAGSDVLTLYQTNAATATSGTSVTTFSADTTAPFSLAIGQKNIYATSTGATGGSTMTIECTPAIVSSLNTMSQSLPTDTVGAGADSNKTTLSITDPATTTMGWGVTTACKGTSNGCTGFDAKTYNGGSTSGTEPDHQFGWYYNKAGVGSSTIPNMFEYAMDASVEAAYRSTGGTSDETWFEWNWDFYPPDISAPLTSSSTGTWVAGDTLTFSGGGTGRLVSMSGSDPTKTIIWRHDYGTTAAGETVSNVTHATSAATLGTLTADPNRLVNTTFGGKSLRPFIMVYRTLTNTTNFDFYTGYGTSPNVSINLGNMYVNGRQVRGNVASGSTAMATNLIAAGACDSSKTSTATGTLSTDTVDWSWAADPGTTGGRLITNPVVSANTITWVVCNASAAGITPTGATINWVVSR